MLSLILILTPAFVIKCSEKPDSKCQIAETKVETPNYFVEYDEKIFNKGNIAQNYADNENDSGSVDGGCQKVSLQTKPKVNLTEYIRETWYVQQQQVNGYQSESDLYCVAATYYINNSVKVPLFNGKVISVYNYANHGKVNGIALGNNSTFLCARQLNVKHPEKLAVAPCFIPNLFAGPYWILAAGPKPSNYTWAVVIGGQPSVRINETCTTRETGINHSGLWIFTRERVADQGNINYIRNIIEKKNISTAKLINVTQRNCSYNGAFIKN